MPRKSSEFTTPRSRKTAKPAESAAVQPTPATAAPEILGKVTAAAVTTNTPAPVAVMPVRTGVRPASTLSGVMQNSVNQSNVNLDEEIRRRAYELYLQRNGQDGDPVGDWFIAEREVRARHATVGHSA